MHFFPHGFHLKLLGGVLKIGYMLKCLRLSLQDYRELRVRTHIKGSGGVNPVRTNISTRIGPPQRLGTVPAWILQRHMGEEWGGKEGLNYVV